MSLRGCIDNAETEGTITPEQASEARDLFDDLETQYQGRMSPGQAASQAGRDTFSALENIALHRKRQKILAYQNWKQITKNLDEYRNYRGEVDPYRAAIAHLARDEGAKFSAFENRVNAVTNAATRSMYNVLASFRKNLIGGTRNKAKLHSMVREVFGEETGDASAREFAQAWAKTAEYLRQRFNAAGGRIVQRQGWGLPQFHDTLQVRKATFQEWRDFIAPRLNVERMVDEGTGLPMTPARLELALKDVYETIRTDGMAKITPGAAAGRGKSMANRRTDHRFLVFRDADSWMEYQTKFGNPDAFDTMMGHISTMSRDIALMEILGPNPRSTINFMKTTIAKRAAGDVAEESRANRAGKKLEDLYMAATGNVNTPVGGGRFAATMAGIRQVLQSAQLGAASISALTDINFQRIARRSAGLPQVRTVTQYLDQLNPLTVEERGKTAIRMGLIAEGWMTVAAAQMRYVGDISGPEITRRIADFTMKASLLSPFTNAGRWAFGMEFYGTLADNVGRAFNDLDPALRQTLEKYGIGSDKWDIIRSTDPYEYEGATFLRAEDIEFRDDINPRLAQDLATRVMEMVDAETNFAVPSSSLKGRATLIGNTQPGTLQGELLRSFAMYKNFGVTLVNTHLMRGMAQAGIKGKGGYFADLLISTTVMGAFAMQLKEMSKGRDPRPMEGTEFWLAAFLQGGGVGIYGDFLFSDVNRFDRGLAETISGPVVGFVNDVRKLTVGNLLEAAHGEDTNAATEAVNFASRYTPGASLWYMRLGLERMVFDRMKRYTDPKAGQKMRRLESRYRREYGQRYWWRPGRDEPGRSPDLGNMLSDAP